MRVCSCACVCACLLACAAAAGASGLGGVSVDAVDERHVLVTEKTYNAVLLIDYLSSKLVGVEA